MTACNAPRSCFARCSQKPSRLHRERDSLAQVANGAETRDQGHQGASPARAAYRHGRTNQRVTTNEHVGRGQRQAVRRSLPQEQSPRARCASGVAWGCRTFCRTPLQSFAPGAGRNARQTLRPEAIEAPRLSRSPRKNAQSRLLSDNVSNGSSGKDRMGPRPQTRHRHKCSFPEMLPFSSPRLLRASHDGWLPPEASRLIGWRSEHALAERRPSLLSMADSCPLGFAV